MRQYLDLLQKVLDEGHRKEDRTGTGTISLFGAQLRFPLSEGFPLLTTKKLHLKSIIYELLWFIRGETHDQLAEVIEMIRKTPDSRRMIVNSWNVGEIDRMALPPCHVLYQFYVADGKLSLQLYQRSADLFLGVPFNIASYARLLMMVAEVTGLEADTFIHTFGDAHIYLNHLDQVREQLTREPRPLPTMRLRPGVTRIEDFTYDDFTLEDYNPWPHISGKVSV